MAPADIQQTTDNQTDKMIDALGYNQISNCLWRPIGFVSNLLVQFHGVCSFIGYRFGREATTHNILWNCHAVPDKLQTHGRVPQMFPNRLVRK